MRNRKAVFACVLILFPTIAFAQNKKKPAPRPEKFVTMKMSTLPIAEFPKNAIRVSGIRVIQRVSDSIRMGYTVKGMDEAVATLKFSKPLTEILQEQVKRMYKHEYKKDGADILWLVKDLRFASKEGIANYSYTRFNADAYISSNGSSFKKACTIDTIFIFINGAGHGSDVENAFRVLLRSTLSEAKDIAEQNLMEWSVEQIAGQPIRHRDVPILNDSIYQEGAYASFEEFLQNKPSIVNYELTVTEKKEARFVLANSSIATWGYCKDGKIYKYYDGALIPIEKQGNSFIISNYVENTTRRNKNIADARLIGAFFAAGTGFPVYIPRVLFKGKPIANSIPGVDEASLQPDATCIDMRTGEFSF